jgi:hypothetical protein
MNPTSQQPDTVVAFKTLHLLHTNSLHMQSINPPATEGKL